MKTKKIVESIELDRWGFIVSEEIAKELYSEPSRYYDNKWIKFDKYKDVVKVLSDTGRQKSVSIEKQILNPIYSLDVEKDYGYYGEAECTLTLVVSGEIEITPEEEELEKHLANKAKQTRKDQKKKKELEERKLLKELIEKYPEEIK